MLPRPRHEKGDAREESSPVDTGENRATTTTGSILARHE
jgi:hypothetical protein